MIRNISGIVIMAFVLVLLLSGCGGDAAEIDLVSAPIATNAQEPAGTTVPARMVTNAPVTAETETPAPSAAAAPATEPTQAQPTIHPTEAPTPDVYFADGERLYRKHNGEDLLIYVATPFFPSGWDCWVGNPVYEGKELYFTEGGMLGDDYTESLHRIIRIDDYGRTVLYNVNVIGFMQLVLYGDRVFFVRDGFDSVEIGWVNKDGSDSAYLDFSDYAAQYGVESYFGSATLYIENDILYADIAFYTNGDPEIVDHTVSISEDLEITRVKTGK